MSADISKTGRVKDIGYWKAFIKLTKQYKYMEHMYGVKIESKIKTIRAAECLLGLIK